MRPANSRVAGEGEVGLVCQGMPGRAAIGQVRVVTTKVRRKLGVRECWWGVWRRGEWGWGVRVDGWERSHSRRPLFPQQSPTLLFLWIVGAPLPLPDGMLSTRTEPGRAPRQTRQIRPGHPVDFRDQSSGKIKAGNLRDMGLSKYYLLAYNAVQFFGFHFR